MIFEEFSNTKFLARSRLISQQIHDLISPILHRRMVTNERVTDHFAEKREVEDATAIQRQMTLYTRQITIDRKVRWKTLRHLLKSLPNLQTVM